MLSHSDNTGYVPNFEFMLDRRYKWIIYIIGITIITTIAVQIYWNYREYQINKINLIGKVQLSLDNSVEAYYANITKSDIIRFSLTDSLNSSNTIDTIFKGRSSGREFRKKISSRLKDIIKNDSSLTVNSAIGHSGRINKQDSTSFFEFRGHEKMDSLLPKIYISFLNDILDLKELDTYLKGELNRNQINVTYGLKYQYYERQYFGRERREKTITHQLENFPENHITTVSNSIYLPHRSKLELLFTNETATVLRDSLVSIFLSLLLSISIISCMIYLLKTIYKQKQLAEVKNDLINNITHELKTPIATISTALEAMKSFNALDDKEKSEKYISMANFQVNKLHVMVEKILEAATFKHEELALDKKPEAIDELVQNVIAKYSLVLNGKKINYNNSLINSVLNLDLFHFENALGAIIDNAIKYGGPEITIDLTSENNMAVLFIKDNGKGIPKSQKERVFEQFYRIPTGNIHNVKGFGIGLYYAKKIIEKHEGTVEILYDENNHTQFKIMVPYA